MTESMIQQLYCTHCTYGSSYVHQRTTGAIKDQSFEYSVRAGSVPRDKSHEYFRQIESYMYYHLPGDLPGDQVLKHDAATTSPWRRLVFVPSVSGLQMLAHVAYRTTDTQGRPGSYFAHVLFSERTEGVAPSWSAAEALKLWGSVNWVVQDDEFPNLELNSFPTLNDFRTSSARTLRTIDDQVLHSFLTAPLDAAFDDPGQLIPARWKQRTPEERQELLIDTLQGFLELNFERRQTMLLAVEPSVAALLFYGVARLLPATGISEKLSFSTYESHEERPRTALSATTFIDTDHTDLPRDPSGARGYAINTFKSLSDTSNLPWKRRPEPPQYARRLVQLLIRQPNAVRDFLTDLELAGAAQPDELEELIRADGWADEFLSGDSFRAAARVRTLKEPVRKYLRRAVEKRLAKEVERSVRSIASAPPPPPPIRVVPPPVTGQSAEIQFATEPDESLPSDRPQGDHQTPSLGGNQPTPAKSAGAPAPKRRLSKELQEITQSPERVLHLLRLIAGNEDTPESKQVLPCLLEVFIESVEGKIGPLLQAEEIASKYKRQALKEAVIQQRQMPDGCEWIWLQSKPSESSPQLTDLLKDLEDETAWQLLLGFLASPLAEKDDPVRSVLDALTQVCQDQPTKRKLLVDFVDHSKLKPTVLQKALRFSHATRKPVFEQYAKFRNEHSEDEFRLLNHLHDWFLELQEEEQSFQQNLKLLDDAKDLLVLVEKEFQPRLEGWKQVLKQLETLKKRLDNSPSPFKKLFSSAHEKVSNETWANLVAAARRAMPDDSYGEERIKRLRAIACEILKRNELPKSYDNTLDTAFAARRSRISSHPSSEKTAPSKSTRQESSESRRNFYLWTAAVLLMIASVGIGVFKFREHILLFAQSDTTAPTDEKTHSETEKPNLRPAKTQDPKTVNAPQNGSKPPQTANTNPVSTTIPNITNDNHVAGVTTPEMPTPSSAKAVSTETSPSKSMSSPKSEQAVGVSPKPTDGPPESTLPIVQKMVEPLQFEPGEKGQQIAYIQLSNQPRAGNRRFSIAHAIPRIGAVKNIMLHGLEPLLPVNQFRLIEFKRATPDANTITLQLRTKNGNSDITLIEFSVQSNVLLINFESQKSDEKIPGVLNQIELCVIELLVENSDRLLISLSKPIELSSPLLIDSAHNIPSELQTRLRNAVLAFGKSTVVIDQMHFAMNPQPGSRSLEFKSIALKYNIGEFHLEFEEEGDTLPHAMSQRMVSKSASRLPNTTELGKEEEFKKWDQKREADLKILFAKNPNKMKLFESGKWLADQVGKKEIPQDKIMDKQYCIQWRDELNTEIDLLYKKKLTEVEHAKNLGPQQHNAFRSRAIHYYGRLDRIVGGRVEPKSTQVEGGIAIKAAVVPPAQ